MRFSFKRDSVVSEKRKKIQFFRKAWGNEAPFRYFKTPLGTYIMLFHRHCTD